MARIEGAITIVCPVETVFDYVADQTHEPRYNPIMVRVEKLTTGEIGPGTRFRSVARSAGRTAEMVTEYTDVERPRLLASVTTMKQAHIVYTLRFDPVAAGTRMQWSGLVRLNGASRPLAPLVTWLGGRQERRIWTGLKRHLEGAPAGEG
ncbi:SRPBCC family protein [Saccharomonospora iraqiensis]|uniref:SRPBCC family protein n=1 Tax=Saccharomonospora iraqiensis TaxID=52698 RepID=UPI0004198C46|nr:SRPBCC family protein [Saccharomonospora iraqiensis]